MWRSMWIGAVSATVMAGLMPATHAESATPVRPPGLISATTSKKKQATGILKVVVKGNGRYWVTGTRIESSHRIYRKAFNDSVIISVKPGIYAIQSDQDSDVHALTKYVTVRAGSRKTVRFRMLAAVRLSDMAYSANPLWSPDGTRMAFMGASNSNGVGAWYVRDLRSGTVNRIADVGEWLPSSASWSPDGTKLVFAMRSPGSPGRLNYYVKDVTTGGLELLSIDNQGKQVSSDSNGTPSWSPDGSRIAFTSGAPDLVPGDTNNAADVFVKDLRDGSTQRVSTSTTGEEANGDSGDLGLSWSPDGTRLAFVSEASNLAPGSGPRILIKNLVSGQIELMNPQIRGKRGDRSALMPAWSPDGTRIAFQSTVRRSDPRYPADGIYVKDLAVGKTKHVGTTDKLRGYPSWAPDSRRVAFNGSDLIVIANIDTGLRQCFPTGGGGTQDEYATWSPDGKLAVTVWRGRHSRAYVTSQFFKGCGSFYGAKPPRWA